MTVKSLLKKNKLKFVFSIIDKMVTHVDDFKRFQSKFVSDRPK